MKTKLSVKDFENPDKEKQLIISERLNYLTNIFVKNYNKERDKVFASNLMNDLKIHKEKILKEGNYNFTDYLLKEGNYELIRSQVTNEESAMDVAFDLAVRNNIFELFVIFTSIESYLDKVKIEY